MVLERSVRCICEHGDKLCGEDAPANFPLCEDCHLALEIEASDGSPHVAEKAKRLLEKAAVPA